MASNSTISIGFKIEDAEGGFKKLTLSGENLRKIMKSNVVEAEKLNKKFINFAAVATSVDQIKGMIGSLASAVKTLTSAYAVQEEAERKLEQVMRNTMNARDEDIQSIKEFCSAQQQIGVIGDEVQLAGAQEMATYLELKGSLKSMIPVMNDMLAQQYGLNATSENAAQIATMLGKVLQGQTGALSRYGYKFDEAQEKILKYGTESERVATLVEVVSQSVGGMNRQLAQTDSGRMKQLENTIGDVKEQLGALAVKIEPVLTIGANATIAVGGVLKLVQAIKALNVSMKALTLTSGAVGLAIAAVGYAIYYITGKAQESAAAMDDLTTAEGRAARAAKEAQEMEDRASEAYAAAESKMSLYISKTKDFNGTKEEEKKLVKELNSAFGDKIGYFKTVSEWYNALIKDSKAYCEQMKAEARVTVLTERLKNLQKEKDQIIYDENGNKKLYSTKKEQQIHRTKVGNVYKTEITEGDSALDKAQQKVYELNKNIQEVEKNMESALKAADSIEMPVVGSATAPNLNSGKGSRKTDKEKSRLEQINAEIKKLQDSYLKASDTEKDSIQKKIDALQKEKEEIERIYAELDRPLSLDSLQDFEKELAYLNKIRKTASQDQIQDIDDEIAAVKKEQLAFETAGAAKLETEEDFGRMLAYVAEQMKTATGDELKELRRLKEGIEESQRAFERANHEYVDPAKITSYRKLEEEIAFYTELLQEGTEEERKFASDNLPALQKKRQEFEKMIASIGTINPTVYFEEPEFEQGSVEDKRQSLQNAKSRIDQLKSDFSNGFIDKAAVESQIAEINALLEGIGVRPIELEVTDNGEILSMEERMRKAQDRMESVTGSVSSMASSFARLGDTIGGTEGKMLSFAMTTIATGADTIANVAKIIAASQAEAIAKGSASAAGLQFPFNLAAIATVVAGITSVFASLPKFADGGIISGPTLGLMGEYAGASNNPEVVAPLNTLKNYIGETSSDWSGRVVFDIDGRKLKGVLERVNRFDSRTR